MRSAPAPEQIGDESNRGEAEGEAQQLVDEVEGRAIREWAIDGRGLRGEGDLARKSLYDHDDRSHPGGSERQRQHDGEFPPQLGL